jgi:bis(5'-nucleosyl)-tetraphosphatase (symmetrical)
LAEYAIGDLQGCYDPFQRLLEKIAFDPDRDRLWITGDLVNRGPKSRKTLRFVRELGDAAVSVLGNHDLHLIALANGIKQARDNYGSLQKILEKDDCGELVDWLRFRPLAHYSLDLNTLMVHAGLPPQWTVDEALEYAADLEKELRSDTYVDFLEEMYGDKPRKWSGELSGNKRLRFIVNSLTRMRMIRANGGLDFSHTGPPEKAANGLRPWFTIEDAKWRGTRIVCGHWSALGLIVNDDLIAIDTGCVWGRQLTAVRLDRSPTVVQVRCGKK